MIPSNEILYALVQPERSGKHKLLQHPETGNVYIFAERDEALCFIGEIEDVKNIEILPVRITNL